jgi:hypothetical protein
MADSLRHIVGTIRYKPVEARRAKNRGAEAYLGGTLERGDWWFDTSTWLSAGSSTRL